MVCALGRGVDPGLLQDLPDGRGTDLTSQAKQFAVDPSVAPPGVLPREAQDQLPQCFRLRWSARTAVWIGPFRATRRACQRRTDRGVTSKASRARCFLFISRSSAAMTARSLQENRGRG
jgi:hypothetical protein